MNQPLFLGVDTAIKNPGVSIISPDGKKIVKSWHPGSTLPGEELGPQRIHQIVSEVIRLKNDAGNWAVSKGMKPLFFWGIEDYLLTRFQTAYETAELVGALRTAALDDTRTVGFSTNHPMKVLKYVRKAKDVSKDEIIAFVEENVEVPGQKTLAHWHGEEATHVADATINALVAKIVYETATKQLQSNDTLESIVAHYPERWREILIGNVPKKKGRGRRSQPTGILTKRVPRLYCIKTP